MAAEVAEVARRCEQVRERADNEDDVPPLDLARCGLASVPAAVFFLLEGVAVRQLTLAHNRLRTLPPQLSTWGATLYGTWKERRVGTRTRRR
jgi:hypothetical protein